MSRAQLLSTLAAGTGPITLRCAEQLRELMCLGCGAALRPIGTLHIEVQPPRPSPVVQALYWSNQGTDAEPVLSIDVPLNFIPRLLVSVVRADLLDCLRAALPSDCTYGNISVETTGTLTGFSVVHDPNPVAVRGTKPPRIHVCEQCGRFLPLAAGTLYVLADALADGLIHRARRGHYVSAGDIWGRLATLPQSVRRTLRVDNLEVRNTPADGLPTLLPATWEEYETICPAPVQFPKRTWTPNASLRIGDWARRKIAARGMDWYFRRPDPREIAIMLALEGEPIRAALEQWPEVRDEVLTYYNEHRFEIKAATERARMLFPEHDDDLSASE